MPEHKISQHCYISWLADRILTLSLHNDVFVKLSEVWLKRKKKIFGTFNCVGSRKIHWLVVCRARFMYVIECQAQIYNCCYKRKIRRCLTQGYNSPPSSYVNKKSIYLVIRKSRVLIWTEFILRGKSVKWAGLYNEENYWFNHVIHRRTYLLGSQMAKWRCFQGLAGRLIHGTETCQQVIICVILYLEQQVTVAVVRVWSLNCQGESKASLDGPESPQTISAEQISLLHFTLLNTKVYSDGQTQGEVRVCSN